MIETPVRVFVALPLSPELHTALGRIQQRLRREIPDGVRWVRPEGIHLTLFFIGETAVTRLDNVREALTVVARHALPCTAQVRGLGAFPSPRRPRVIWVGLEEPSGRLALLHQAVNEALEHAGYEPESRAFTPHLTLGRVQQGRDGDAAQLGEAMSRAAAQPCDLGAVQFSELVLFRSQLQPQGAVYTPLATFPLEGVT